MYAIKGGFCMDKRVIELRLGNCRDDLTDKLGHDSVGNDSGGGFVARVVVNDVPR